MIKKIKAKSAEIRDLIERSNSILLHSHPRPDMDSLGSALALRQVLLDLGKKVTIIEGDGPLPQFLSNLPGFSEIVRKSYLQIDSTEFDLFIVLDCASVNRISERGEVTFPSGMKVLVIDHHATNDDNFGDLSLVIPEGAATSEILFYLFKEWGVRLGAEAAICLLAGIRGDTGGYTYSNTSELTFAASAALRALVPNYHQYVEAWNEEDLDRLVARGLGLSKAQKWGAGKFILATIALSEIAERGLELTSFSNNPIAATFLKSPGCLVAATLVEEQLGKIKLSFRSRDDNYDVSKLATSLGGGGHRRAAGTILSDLSIQEAKNMLLPIVEKTYPELLGKRA